MIKLYSAKMCFHCADAKRKLKEKGIEFEELDAVDHLDYLNSLGRPQLPIIMDGDKLVTLEELLK